MPRQRKPKLFAGTSGWAYPSWKPGFYPHKWPSKRFLEHYSTRLNSVEVNYTFRALPTAAQVSDWLAAVPPGFRFSFKAPESITHRKRLRECGEAVAQLVASLEPVCNAGALGCLLFQLPPNFKADHARLQTFLSLPELQPAQRVAFEFRHESWFCDDTWALLRSHHVAVCIAESETLATPEVHTAKQFTYYRLRMPGGYDAATAANHAAKFRHLSARREVYVYYKHEDEPHGPLAAEAMLERATAAVLANSNQPGTTVAANVT